MKMLLHILKIIVIIGVVFFGVTFTVYIFNLWKAGGATPGGYYLARMHEAGCDVIYILTGQRKAASDAATSEFAVWRIRKTLRSSSVTK